jgi:hypothetical protein
MKKFKSLRIVLSLSFVFLFSITSFSQVNEKDTDILLRGALGSGQILWGYVDYSGGSGDVGKGTSFLLDMNAMANYKFLAAETSFLYGTISELKWSGENNTTKLEENWTSTGGGYMLIFDLNLGTRLFVEEADMGYTFFYAGLRLWQTKRDQDSVKFNGNTWPTTQSRTGSGAGWTVGLRDYSTFNLNDDLSIALQTGFFLGKAPVGDMTDSSGDPVTHPKDTTLTGGYEIGLGAAFEKTGLSVMGIFSGDFNITTFKDPAAPKGEESVFAFGYLWNFKIEVQQQLNFY